jgi:hypothetical protein
MRRVLAGSLVLLAAACVPRSETPRPLNLDPDATFAAHSTHGGLMIDRLDRAGIGRVEVRGRGWNTPPRFVVRTADAVLGSAWLVAPATAVARDGTTAWASTTVRVEPAWVDQAIRLTLRTEDATLRTGAFERVDGGSGIRALGRTAQTNLDVRGTFRATVVDTGGAEVGWVQVRVPSPDEPRVFQAALPPVPRVTGPAIAVALGSELDWIEEHTIDVYRGAGRDRGSGLGRER